MQLIAGRGVSIVRHAAKTPGDEPGMYIIESSSDGASPVFYTMSCPIAIVGIACRYPDADTVEQLFENSLAQRRSFRKIPDA